MEVNTSLLDSICLKTKIATLCFILGKMTFAPSVYFIFSGQKELALISIYIYSALIVASLVLSIIAVRSKRIDTSMLSRKIKLSGEDNSVFTVVVKDGKVISINQGES